MLYVISPYTRPCNNKAQLLNELAMKYKIVKLIAPLCRIYVSINWVIIGPGNGLSLVRCQAITWTNAGLLSIGLMGTYFSEIWIEILSFSFKKMQLKMSSARMVVNKLGHHWSRQWLVACSAPSHYLNQCWIIVNWTYFSEIWIEILSFSFKKMQLKKSSAKMVAILSRGRWIKGGGGINLKESMPGDKR